MEQRHYLVLRVRAQVNKQVAARDQIDMRERGIAQNILLRKNDLLADLPGDPQVTVFLHEKTCQQLGRDVRDDALREKSTASPFDGALIHIGRENLHVPLLIASCYEFLHEHGDRVSLFPCGTSWHPDAERFPRGRPLQDRRQNLVTQNGKDFAIAKESRNVDQQVAPERRDFLLRLLEELQIVVWVGELCDANAALDAADHRARLVAGEVYAGLPVHEAEDFVQVGLVDFERCALRACDEWMPDEF